MMPIKTTADLMRETYRGLNTILSDQLVMELTNPDKGKLESISTNLDAIMPAGYVESHRFNLLKRQPESFDHNENRFVPLESSAFGDFFMKLDATLCANGIKRISQQDAKIIYDKMVNVNKVDPFYEYIKTLKWDGIPRLRRWFIDGLGAHIPSLSEEESTYLVEEVTQAWFMGAVKRSQHTQKFEIIPILKSSQQGIGKSTYVQYTALSTVSEEWYRATTANVDDPKRFFETIAGGKIVEWAEARELSAKNSVEELKAFISQDTDTYRDSYAKYSTSYSRRWIPIITTNESTLFSDTTGNRRFVPLECDISRATRRVKYDEMDRADLRYDVEQVWAEAIVIEAAGGKAYLSEKAEKLAIAPQREGMRGNDFFDKVYETLDLEFSEVGVFISNDELRMMYKMLYDLYPQMKNRSFNRNDIINYHPGEWVPHVGAVKKEGKNGTYKSTQNGIKRVKESPRVQMIYDKEYGFTTEVSE